jgi:hypothetical protein
MDNTQQKNQNMTLEEQVEHHKNTVVKCKKLIRLYEEEKVKSEQTISKLKEKLNDYELGNMCLFI